MTGNFELSKDQSVAVATDYFWKRIDDDTPHGVKLQLLGIGGVAAYGQWDGKNRFWTHYAPLPRMPKATQ
jgi:hypothetical protein